MSEQAITLSQQTYEAVKRLAETTEQTIDQVIRDLALQPTTYIVTRPGVQGGEPCIKDTRIPVWVLAAMHRQGVSKPQCSPGIRCTELLLCASRRGRHRNRRPERRS